MKNIFEEISRNIQINNKGRVIINIAENLLDTLCEVLAYNLKKNVEILVVDQYSSNLKLGSHFQIEKDKTFNWRVLAEYGYTRVNRVWNESEFAVLGDVVIFWKKGEEFVTRVSMFGDNVDEIALLEESTRRMIKRVDKYNVSNESEVNSRYISNTFFKETKSFIYSRNPIEEIVESIDIGMRPFPGNRFSQIEKIVQTYVAQGFDVYISSEAQDVEDIKGTRRVKEVIKRGFVISNLKIAVVTDFELSGKIDLLEFEKKNGKSNKIFKEISRGDYVVHQDHGIGVYDDTVLIDGNAYLDIHYAGKDRILVPLSSSDKLSKYIGAGKSKPKLTGLNSGVWLRIKGKAKEDIFAMASELVALYAMRKLSKSAKVIRSDEDIKELAHFVEKFKYQDTEDQMVITQEIIKDLSRDIPMDRLVVGDVGFGKTELAARAMFLAVNSGYQVALLAPTTILSMQHFNVLKERFEDYPFRLGLLNRYVTDDEKEKELRDIAEGKIDIIIGTHSLLSDAVKFSKLGLLIIDEEQKFGVNQKEGLKKKRLDVHTLSMTATPIPRTLNMALSGIRDLSILSSVPQGRKAIQNHLGEFDWDIAEKAIRHEIERGGQVYYLHNRVADLKEIKEEIEKRIPGIKVELTHGQMSQERITRVMDGFSKGDINVLVCSSIIENGLDIPNVNTIIVDDAQRYGLSSLYQIRGRVGRSSTQAYAYIFHSNLMGSAALRLDALAEANNIGSGFILSNRDLEIRGAGNILGKSQSGAINSIGYGLYTQMLEEAVNKLQDKRYK